MNETVKTIAVMGGGNGGFAHAADLSLKGFQHFAQ